MTVSLTGRKLVLLWLAVLVLSVLYCELTAVVYDLAPAALQVSCVWALQTWLGWMALSLFAGPGARWAINTAASARSRVAGVVVGSIVGLAALDAMGTWLLASLCLIEPIDVLEQAYVRAPRFLAGGVFIAAALEYLRWRTVRRAATPPAESRTPDTVSASPSIRVSNRAGELHLALSSVESIESAGNYVQIILPDGRSFLHRGTLKEMEAVAKPHGWRRIHRTALVNPSHVKSWASSASVRLSSGRVLRIGRAYRSAVESRRPRSRQ